MSTRGERSDRRGYGGQGQQQGARRAEQGPPPETSPPSALPAAELAFDQERHLNIESPCQQGREGQLRGSSPRPCPKQGRAQCYRSSQGCRGSGHLQESVLHSLPGNPAQCSTTPILITFSFYLLGFPLVSLDLIAVVLLLCTLEKSLSAFSVNPLLDTGPVVSLG